MRRPSIRKIFEPNLDTSILPHYLLCGCVGSEREGGSSVAKKKDCKEEEMYDWEDQIKIDKN